MLRRVAVAATVLGAALCAASPALAATYTVNAVAGEGSSCQGTSCPSLRAAFQQAAASPGSTIDLPLAGTYTLSQATALALTQANANVTINGTDARQTIIQGVNAQVFTVASGTTLQLNTLTVTGGVLTQGTAGGDILNQGTLALNQVRVSGGTAPSGGGVANLGGVATIANSLIDDNVASSVRGLGGGLFNAPSPAGSPGSLTVVNSTVAFNRATGDGFGGGMANSAGVADLGDRRAQHRGQRSLRRVGRPI
jgi:hypothetical protein